MLVVSGSQATLFFGTFFENLSPFRLDVDPLLFRQFDSVRFVSVQNLANLHPERNSGTDRAYRRGD